MPVPNRVENASRRIPYMAASTHLGHGIFRTYCATASTMEFLAMEGTNMRKSRRMSAKHERRRPMFLWLFFPVTTMCSSVFSLSTVSPSSSFAGPRSLGPQQKLLGRPRRDTCCARGTRTRLHSPDLAKRLISFLRALTDKDETRARAHHVVASVRSRMKSNNFEHDFCSSLKMLQSRNLAKQFCEMIIL